MALFNRRSINRLMVVAACIFVAALLAGLISWYTVIEDRNGKKECGQLSEVINLPTVYDVTCFIQTPEGIWSVDESELLSNA